LKSEFSGAIYTNELDSVDSDFESEQIETLPVRTGAIVAATMAESSTALEQAILEASKAGQWAVVAMLARELEARRLGDSGGAL
jgi:hypothetical protein